MAAQGQASLITGMGGHHGAAAKRDEMYGQDGPVKIVERKVRAAHRSKRK